MDVKLKQKVESPGHVTECKLCKHASQNKELSFPTPCTKITLFNTVAELCPLNLVFKDSSKINKYNNFMESRFLKTFKGGYGSLASSKD